MLPQVLSGGVEATGGGSRRASRRLRVVSRRSRRLVWTMVVAGATVRVLLAMSTVGAEYDMTSLHILGELLRDGPLHVYGNFGGRNTWPYPPGFFPFIVAARTVAEATPLPFHGVVQVPAITADAGLALVVQSFLGQRGAGERTRLAATALVALGPSFALISGYHGQIDSVAILPAAVSLVVWERQGPDRALAAGALIGLGATFKTVPIVLLLALLPSVRSRAEAMKLVVVAMAIPAAALAPFFIATPRALLDALSYSGLIGYGGLSLAVQPELAQAALGAPGQYRFDLNDASRFLFQFGGLVTAGGVLAYCALMLRWRVAAPHAAVLAWLAVYATGPVAFQYAIWGLPFFIMAGYLRQAALVQAALLVPGVLLYAGPWENGRTAVIYAPIMLAVWASGLFAFFVLVRRERGRAARPRVRPPRANGASL